MKPSRLVFNDSRVPGAIASAARGARLVLAGVLYASVLLMTGCAADMAYREAQSLVANDNVEAGLVKYQEALSLDPNNAEFRAGYAQARERSTNAFLERADRLFESAQYAESERQYRRVLAYEARNERARAGVQIIARVARHESLLNEAAAEVDMKNLEAARAKLATVLAENPKNDRARTMLRGIEDKAEAPVLESLLAATYKKPITIDFKDAPLRQIFDAIAHSSGLNILFDKDVKLEQKASIYLKNSNIETAIYYLLLTNQLEQQVMDANTLLIYSSNAGKQKDYQQLLVRTFLLSNANAKIIAESLKSVMKLRDVTVNEKMNMLIVRDSPEAIKLAEKLIVMQDVAEPEVMLEVEIMEVTHGRLTELGVSLPGSLALMPLSSSSGATLTVADLRNLTKDSIGVSIDPVKINARKVDSDTNILANPRIRVFNHEKAKVMIGNRVPSITTSVVSTGIITESVNYLDVGLKLEVEPTIYLDNDVAIRIGLEVSNIVDTQKSTSGTVTYTIGTRTANTMLRLKDGENQVLAGLINDEDRRTANKLPGLGDVPVVGRLFGSTLRDGSKSEIVLSITPHLIRNIKRPDAASLEFLSGTENSLRRRPDLTARPVSTATQTLAPVSARLPVAASAPVSASASELAPVQEPLAASAAAPASVEVSSPPAVPAPPSADDAGKVDKAPPTSVDKDDPDSKPESANQLQDGASLEPLQDGRQRMVYQVALQ